MPAVPMAAAVPAAATPAGPAPDVDLSTKEGQNDIYYHAGHGDEYHSEMERQNDSYSDASHGDASCNYEGEERSMPLCMMPSVPPFPELHDTESEAAEGGEAEGRQPEGLESPAVSPPHEVDDAKYEPMQSVKFEPSDGNAECVARCSARLPKALPPDDGAHPMAEGGADVEGRGGLPEALPRDDGAHGHYGACASHAGIADHGGHEAQLQVVGASSSQGAAARSEAEWYHHLVSTAGDEASELPACSHEDVLLMARVLAKTLAGGQAG